MINLTGVEQSYVHTLLKNKDQLEEWFEDETINKDNYCTKVSNLIISVNTKDLDHKSKATKRFLESVNLIKINKYKTKLDLLSLCWNSILKGDNCGVI